MKHCARMSLDDEGRRIVEALGGRWTPAGAMCRCPAHRDRTPSLSVRPGRTRLLLHCFAGCQAAEILRRLDSVGLLSKGAGQDPAPTASQGGSASARRLWAEAQAIAGTPGEHYLARRGLQADSEQLRYHPQTPLGRRPNTEFRPALIAAVRDRHGIAAVHRTFIDPLAPALAPIASPKRTLGCLGAGAVRLGGVAPRLGLAEGIESALAVTALFGIPCWATLGTERFGAVNLPGEVTELRLFPDNDAAGRRAEMLARRAFGNRLRIEACYSPGEGEDWNDALAGARVNPIPHAF